MPPSKETLSITDNRTGKSYEIPIAHDTIKAIDLRQIKVKDDDFGMMTYDPAFMNTASCKSTITFIDGDKGILEYRGYPIDQLAEKCSYHEVAYLLVYGELPNAAQLDEWTKNVNSHLPLPDNFSKLYDGFTKDAHPMGMLVSALGALSTYYPGSKKINDPAERLLTIHRLVAKVPTLAAYGYRHSQGLPYIAPDPKLSYAANFLHMMFGTAPQPALEKALDVLFTLHADHEQNCSTSAMRGVGSSRVDPFSAAAAAAAALYGPLHGGANEEVLRMLDHIGSVNNIPAFIKDVKEGKGRLMGFGHRVYKNFDPRAKIIKRLADQVFAVTGRNPKLDIALELEKIALQDEYFVKRKLYPNVDFYSGLIYQALKLPVDMFPVLFAIGRMSGWLSQWQEMVIDEEQKITRPRQVFLGSPTRSVAR
jgi:citrate synthase